MPTLNSIRFAICVYCTPMKRTIRAALRESTAPAVSAAAGVPRRFHVRLSQWGSKPLRAMANDCRPHAMTHTS